MSKWTVREVSKNPKIRLSNCLGTDDCGCELCLMLIAFADQSRRRGSDSAIEDFPEIPENIE